MEAKMPREIIQEYSLNSNPDIVFDALLKPGMIQKWWSAKSAIVNPEAGGIYAVTWGEDINNPDYISAAKIAQLDKPNRILLTEFQYRSKDGPLPFEADLVVEFILKPESNGTLLTVCQRGFPDHKQADEFYNGCVQGWIDTMTSFRNTIEGM
jgi:uncharacterized protein YndB with AHSA1/START domain